MYYFDHAATTNKKPDSVAQAVYAMLASAEYGNPNRGANCYSLNSYKKIEETRKKLKRLFVADDDYEVIFQQNATMALNTIIKGLLTEKDHVITTVTEHNSVLRPLYQLGLAISFLPLTTSYEVDLTMLEKLKQINTKAVIVSHVSNVTGSALNLEKISHFCRTNKLLLLVDVAQSAGVLPINCTKYALDAICFTGHKSLFGPQGIGGICLKKTLVVEPLFSGGSGILSMAKYMPIDYPEHLEAGTLNTPGIMGLSAGIDYLCQQGEAALEKEQRTLANLFYNGIKDLAQLTCYANPVLAKQNNIISFTLKGIDSATIATYLEEQENIIVRSGMHCAPLIHQELGTKATGVVRFSFSSMNTELEVRHAIEAVKKLVKIM
ncbi:aminotransferase class V-fold PLP-dependent enzyme [Enterococcus termitis]|uniref:Aminotransferase class V domain-containing protein n=1 Tax=Enterococcus termitis TaxID=332950 RepID=A0A1E5GCW1_9ENTE|nr:aminotransferase class V-fold PLP-dependent enzyme [Enterococcus termitis]OEG10491.1 hypothetical protein BCR25_08410 [Enterococcus termitis]OJG97476.1 cysteine desulfurase [Enterococcus termitis]